MSHILVSRVEAMKLNLENCLLFYLEVGAKICLGWREGRTILRVLQRPSHEQAQTVSLRSYVTSLGCVFGEKKKCVFLYLIIPLNI